MNTSTREKKIMGVEKDKILYIFSHSQNTDPISCVCNMNSKEMLGEGGPRRVVGRNLYMHSTIIYLHENAIMKTLFHVPNFKK